MNETIEMMTSGHTGCHWGDGVLSQEPPVSGRGEFSQEFLKVLRVGLDNAREFEGSWRQLAHLLLNSSTAEIKEFNRLASYDSSGMRSPTNEVLGKFMERRGSKFDVGAFWYMLQHKMHRDDLAAEMILLDRERRLLHEPASSSVYEDMTAGAFQSLATAPPQEGSDVCSVVREGPAGRSSRGPVDQLMVTANTVIITQAGRGGVYGLRNVGETTETTSLGSSSTSSGSSSSLPRDSEGPHTQPKMVDLPPIRSCSSYQSSSSSGQYELIPPRKETVLISYAAHDEPKAVDIGLHLEVHGYKVILDNGGKKSEGSRKKKCQQIFGTACAVVVIYSIHYKQEITAKKGNGRNTRFIHKLLKEEFDQGNTNRRCVFYPMYQVQSGSKIPRIFNRLPGERSAAMVHRALFVPVEPAPSTR